MLQPATAESVEGNFAAGQIVLDGSTYNLERRDTGYFITESDITGKPWPHRIDFTLGGIRIQHYMTKLPDGRIVVLPPTWDVRRRTWIAAADAQNPEQGEAVQVWNKACYSCHASGAEKNFDLASNSYHTTWRADGIDCEACHGPGAAHVAQASAHPYAADTKIVNPSKFDPTRSTMVCAECHSFRDIYAVGFKPGDNYYDFFVPVMEYRLPASQDPAYWPDGRPRWLSNETLALWQSQCFLKGGATCATCHTNSHSIDLRRNPQLRPGNNALCAKCHASIAANLRAHTHHGAASAGSSCIECHMPRIVTSLRTRMRDHSLSIPVPENTIRHQIPNACNLCHSDKTAQWAFEQVRAWYPDERRQGMIDRADAFSEGRKGDAAAIPALMKILADQAQSPFIRANAAGYLANFPNDPAAYEAVLKSFNDSEPLVRETAAIALRPRAAQREAVAPQLVAMLRDNVTTVRMSAAISLVGMGVRQVPPEDAPWFDRAKELYGERAALGSDDAQQQLAAGKFFFLAGDMDRAAADFRATIKLDPSIPAQYYLALSLEGKGDFEPAQQLLESIPRDDQQYDAAQRLLAEIAAKKAEKPSTGADTATGPGTSQADASFLNGQLEYQDGHYENALASLDSALHLAPDASWATKARIYRAICLEKLSRTQEAETAMQTVSSEPAARDDLDFQLAYVELLDETGRPDDALKRADALIATAPKVALAFLWRARLLVELHRPADAATAAEESVRLAPDAPAAHNLLLRIYQMLGRTKEAAEQAEWLRDYERRMQSH